MSSANEWPMVRLGEVAKFIRGVTFKPADKVNSEDGIPVMRTKNVQASLEFSDVIRIPASLVKEDRYLRVGDTLVSTANSWNLVGKCCWVPELTEPTAIGGFVSALRATSEQILPRYLYYWFNSYKIQATVRSFSNQTTNIANLAIKRCLDLKIPLPPLPEQQRITQILDLAASTLSLAQEEAMRADESRSALFGSLFPASNYAVATIGDFLSETQYGSSKKAGGAGEYPVLRMGNLSSTGSISYSDLKYLDLEEKEISKHTLRNRDVLFNRTNSKELVGKTAVYYGEDDQVAYAGYLIRCRTNGRATPEFISGFLNSRLGKAQLFLRAKAIVGMANINAQELRTLSIPDVPVEEQEKYASLYQQLEDVRLVVEKKINKLEELQKSLSTLAFTGQL